MVQGPVEFIPRLYEFIKNAYFTNVSQFHSYRQLSFETKRKLLNNKIEYALKHCDVLRLQDDKNPNVIYGFSLYTRDNNLLTVYFIYIKKPFRQMGFAKKLMEQMKQNCDTFEYVLLKDVRKFSLFHNFKLNKSLL